MNIFYTDSDPTLAAQSLPDRHIVKMPVETVQMLVSSLMRYDCNHGVLTQAGNIHKGGYANHPCTVWAGNTQSNFLWLLKHGHELCREYTFRYGRVHFAESQLSVIDLLSDFIPDGKLTFPALAMPDRLQVSDPVESYRNCIRAKVNEKPGVFLWNRGRAKPEWMDRYEESKRIRQDI